MCIDAHHAAHTVAVDPAFGRWTPGLVAPVTTFVPSIAADTAVETFAVFAGVLGIFAPVLFAFDLAAACSAEGAAIGATGLNTIIVGLTLWTGLTFTFVDHLGHGACGETGIVVFTTIGSTNGHIEERADAPVGRTPAIGALLSIGAVLVANALSVVHADAAAAAVRIVEGSLSWTAFAQDIDVATLTGIG